MRVPGSVILLAARASTATAVINITADVPISVPSSQPPFAKLMNPALASFSLEFQFWPTYAGNATNQPNQYVNQLLGNLGERTGKSPAIRVGGQSNVFPLWLLESSAETTSNYSFSKMTAHRNEREYGLCRHVVPGVECESARRSLWTLQ